MNSALSQRTRPRGLTMAIAIFLLALVAVALVSIAQLVRTDAHRTLKESQDAQLRALALAGITAAQQALRDHDTLPAEMAVPLPPTLPEANLRLSNRAAGDRWIVQTVARLGDTESVAETTFARTAGVWIVVDAQPTTRPATARSSQP